MIRLLIASLLLTLSACVLPGAQVNAVGSLVGEVHMNSEWIVVVGEADFTLAFDPGFGGVIVTFPIQNASADGWTAIRLSDFEVLTGRLGDPLPEGALL